LSAPHIVSDITVAWGCAVVAKGRRTALQYLGTEPLRLVNKALGKATVYLPRTAAKRLNKRPLWLVEALSPSEIGRAAMPSSLSVKMKPTKTGLSCRS
jgi:hypothetical protein